MGMVVYLREVSPAQITELTQNPSNWEQFAFEEAAPGELVDVDKAWHALHFMLTETSGPTDSPLNILSPSDDLYGADEHGFGGFSLVSPSEMKAFSVALSELTDQAIAARYDPAAMVAEDIYLGDSFADEGDEGLTYIMQGIPDLRLFANRCAANGSGAFNILS